MTSVKPVVKSGALKCKQLVNGHSVIMLCVSIIRKIQNIDSVSQYTG